MVQTENENNSQRSGDRESVTCPPDSNATITPPGEVSLVLAGAAFGLSLGFALGAIFGARAGRR